MDRQKQSTDLIELMDCYMISEKNVVMLVNTAGQQKCKMQD